jgi:SOS-response transcriptional repressor LexA
MKPDSVREIGCIHTCQGLELDYVGVIIGPDLVVRDGEVVTDGAKRSGGDSSIKGYKGLLKNDSASAREKADLIIKNTYRTLMTRGTKGCYVYSTDAETNQYLQTQGVGALLPEFEELQISQSPPAYPFPILSPEEAADCPNAVPIFDIKIAAGDFSKEQWLEDCQYAELPDHFTAKPGFFVAQVVGESMNRRIPNGSWCLFREPTAGSRNGKVVIVQSRDIQDPDNGGQYTVKIYRSDKNVTEDSWSHRNIRLEPDSMDFNFKTLTLNSDASNDLRVIGEYAGIIS